MTPASPLSRLEKLAEESLAKKKQLAEITNGVASVTLDFVEIYMEAGKSMLSLLSEPGEACGPRVWLNPSDVLKSGYLGSTEHPGDYFEYCDLRELTQARAEIEQLRTFKANVLQDEKTWQEVACDKMDELKDAKAALASSEARVRVLEEDYKRLGEVTESFRISLNEAEARVREAEVAIANYDKLAGENIELREALDVVRKYFAAQDLPSHCVTLTETMELRKLALQALLEVQR